jgi:hypothetical protein
MAPAQNRETFMFGNWFSTKEVDEVADAIVADLVKRLPPTPGAHTRKTADRLRKTHDVIFARLEQFALSRKLNIYQKARLGNRVRWALREAGYAPEFTDALSYELVTVATLASRQAGKAGG